MKQLAIILGAALVALAACNDTTNTETTQLNLDRPVDIAFACYGGLRLTDGNAATPTQTLTTSAQPQASCIIRSRFHEANTPQPVPPGQEDLDASSKVGPVEWYAFILQSGPGTVAMAHYGTKASESFTGNRDVQIIDVDPLTPGVNGISVGEDPVAIATDKVGCYEVVANAGSCDLSTLDINSIFAAPEPLVNRLDVKNAAGEVIRSRPAAMAFEPPGGTIGAACPAQPTGLAYIAYPSCHMVAGVDVATGTIVTSLRFDANGIATIGDGNVTCPAECDGAPPTAGTRPVSLDLERDERTGRIVLAIGSDNSDLLTVFDLDLQTNLPQSRLPIAPLEHPATTKLGLTSVAISPVIGMGGINGSDVGVIDDTAPGGDHQFVYAVATDGTIRVADLSGAPRECDTQVDPRYLANIRDVDQLSCFQVGAASTPPRRAGARGPGIELVGDPIPTSVDIVRAEAKDSRAAGDPTKIIGYIAAVTAANGQVFTVTVDNDDFYDYIPSPSEADQLKAPIPLDIAHQLRDSVRDRGKLAERSPDGMPNVSKFVCDDPGPDPNAQGGNSGGPRLAGSIQTTVPAGIVANEKTGGLPSIRQVRCHDELKELDPDTAANPDRPVSELFFSAPLDVRVAEFPDLRALRSDETWTLTYEGSLSNDKADSAIDGPAVRTGQLSLDSSGFKLQDQTRPFCDAGVEPYDIVQLRGCDPSLGDAGCPIGYTCFVHPQSTVTGIGACMLVDEAERLATACKSFLTSLRRYTVGRTKSGELQLLPRKAVLRTTPITGCTSDDQCEQLADYAIQNASSLNPSDAGLPTDPKTWRCQVDPDRKQTLDTSNQPRKRCLAVCDSDADCGVGTVCQGGTAGSGTKAGYCMEGVVPPQSCVNAPQRYELHAGEAFAVLGSRQGYMHPIKSENDVCVRDPNANPLQVGRIPLDAPACTATNSPNPCKLTVDETEYQLNYVPGTCTLGDPDETVETRQATAIRFSNRAMTLTLVDPTYQGDAVCHGDRKGTLDSIPLVMPGYQIAFRQTAGFTPLTVPGIQPALPIKALKSPTNDSFWVIDEGDFLSTSLSQASTRGKVIRVESRAINIFNLIE